ncbi:MAG: amidohydrolase [Proteobacteria bacterium]|nr:amidohydrolase [Pseudomonadota bacterium]
MSDVGTLYTGGTIWTLDAAQPDAEAIAVRDGRILAVGDASLCTDVLGRRHERVDLRGGCLLPGFIDTHLHLIGMLYFEQNVDLREVSDIAGLQRAMREAATQCDPDEWVIGLQLDDEALAEKRLPTRLELDEACSELPVVILEHDGHTAIGNTRALEAAGIHRDTPDPPGGRIDRDANGDLAGPCRETAAQVLLGSMPPARLDRLREAGQRCFSRLSSYGITSVGVITQTDEEGPAGEAGRLESLALQLLLEEIPFHLYSIAVGRTIDGPLAARKTSLHDPEAGHRVGGYKIFADGTFGSCTACMHEPFSDTGQQGFMTLTEDEIFDRMCAAEDAGFQICVHAIGDAANRACVDLYERLFERRPSADRRHRIEHASLLPPELIKRMAALGVAVSTQPLFLRSECAWLERRLGPERIRQAYPFRSLIDAGVRLAGASDAPVESPRVVDAIHACVTRHGVAPEEAISVEEAVGLFTSQAAVLQFEENEKGRLVPGLRADLAVLSEDPRRVDPERLCELEVTRTVVDGVCTHSEESA